MIVFENLVKGNMEDVLNAISEQYTNGATPMIILQDLINITHDMAKIKIVPQLLSSTSLSEVEKNTFTDLSGNCSLAILSKIWQMLIKGITEINIAPSSVEALEMILLRVAYSASMPTPYEILTDVKKNSSLIVNSQQNVAENEKKNDVGNIPLYVFNTVDDLLKYLEKSKKALLEYSIKNDVTIHEFTNGRIAMSISSNIHQDFIISLHKLLNELTNKKWEIDIVKGEVTETIADKEKSVVEASRKNVTEYPLVKKILEEFKGAKIETIVRKNLEKLAEEEINLDETIVINNFDDEE